MTRLTQKHHRLSHAAFIHRIVLTAALIFLPNLSFAVPDIDRSSEFVVGGMSFFCSNCETKAVGPTGEELCEIEAEGGRLLDSCSHAVTILLRSALTLNSDAKSSRPTIVELQNSLLKPSALVNAEAAGLIVQLLLRTPEGERALTEQLDGIVALHASALIALSETIGQHPQLLKAIWGLPSRNDDPLRMQLRLIA